MNSISFLLALILIPFQAISAQANAAEVIVIGRSLVLSGPLRSYGEAKRDGSDAYIQKINRLGGVGGKQIELVTMDDGYVPDNTVANLRKMAAENAPIAFLGLFGLPCVAAALPIFEELKIPGVGLTSGAEALRKPFKRYAFPVRASFSDESRKLVSHVKTINISKLSVIYTDNPFGETAKNTLLTTLKEAGLTAATIKIDPAANEADAAAAKAAKDAPQAIFLTMLSQAALPVLTALNNAAYRGALYTFSPVDTTAITKQLGSKAQGLAITQIVPIPKGAMVKIVAEYLQSLKDSGKGTPSFYGLEGYIEAKVLVEGLKKAGGKPSSASLVKALETMHDYDLGGYFVSYSSDLHPGSAFVEIDVINSSGEIMR
jgi:branched-chain amino acid transport system substrate-binding protein